MPALGGPLTYVGNGYSPSWSADGKALLYTHYDGGFNQSSLRMADVAARPRTYTAHAGDTLWDIALMFGLSVDELKSANELTSDTIRPGQILTLPPPTQTILGRADLQSDSANFNVQGVRSPSGEQIAFVAFGFTNTGQADRTWIGSIDPADSSATVLFDREQVWAGPPEFSADGRFLATQLFGPEGSQSQTIVVDTATHQVLPWEIPQFAWSPSGHRLMGISSTESLVLVDDPHNPQAEELLKTSCYNVLWRPTP
jgi:LysM repeat protein